VIPLYGMQAVGGKVYSLDDQSVVKDATDAAGVGGTAFNPFIVSTPFAIQADLGYNRLRRFLQRIAHGGACTLTVTGIRDGQDSGVSIVRPLTVSDIGIVNVPLGDSGSDFQLRIELSAYDAETALGNSQVFIVPKRRFR
jgi:hypothetical protein